MSIFVRLTFVTPLNTEMNEAETFFVSEISDHPHFDLDYIKSILHIVIHIIFLDLLKLNNDFSTVYYRIYLWLECTKPRLAIV